MIREWAEFEGAKILLGKKKECMFWMNIEINIFNHIENKLLSKKITFDICYFGGQLVNTC